MLTISNLPPRTLERGGQGFGRYGVVLMCGTLLVSVTCLHGFAYLYVGNRN